VRRRIVMHGERYLGRASEGGAAGAVQYDALRGVVGVIL
jgi:hypothetical protein